MVYKFKKRMEIMKKLNYVIICLLILLVFIFTIILIRTNKQLDEVYTNFDVLNKQIESIGTNSEIQTAETLTLLQLNQQKMEDLLAKLDLQLNMKIVDISNNAETQNTILNRAIKSIGSSGSLEVKDVKDILLAYIEEDKEYKEADSIKTEITTVETDVLIQQLLDESLTMYQEENFTTAIKVYRKILDIDPSNVEAKCYLNASQYYQNPGDGSNFYIMKSDLIPLLEENILSYDEERTTLNVLIGIGMEEGDSTFSKIYQDKLQKLEENGK